MKFTKMHGCGNDYVYINGFQEKVEDSQKPELVRKMSDRHFGVGSDGVIFINPSEVADFEMEMWNADGTRAEMCGNGIRCVAKYVYDKGLTNDTEISIVSAGKIKYLKLTVRDGLVETVRVNMGAPILQPDLIPVISSETRNIFVESEMRHKDGNVEAVIAAPIVVEGRTYHMTCVSMGNPHAVIFVEDVKSLDLEKIGPHFECHQAFPKKTNTEFVKVIDSKHVEMRVWERGTGETLACGTGCCATAVACVLNGLTDNQITVKLLGGELLIEWNREENTVYMTGPAATVFEGQWEL